MKIYFLQKIILKKLLNICLVQILAIEFKIKIYKFVYF